MRIEGLGETDLTKLSNHTNNELKKLVIDAMATRYDDQIENELLYDLVGRYVLLAQKLDEKIEEVNRLSITDPLTQTYNRLHFANVFENEQKDLTDMAMLLSYNV